MAVDASCKGEEENPASAPGGNYGYDNDNDDDDDVQAASIKAASADLQLSSGEAEQHKAAAAALRAQLKDALLRLDQAEGMPAANPSPVKQKTLAKLHTALDEALQEGQRSQEALRLANVQVSPPDSCAQRFSSILRHTLSVHPDF